MYFYMSPNTWQHPHIILLFNWSVCLKLCPVNLDLSYEGSDQKEHLNSNLPMSLTKKY